MNRSPPVQFQLAARSGLAREDRSAMFELLTRHFEGVTPDQFSRDLAEKDLVIQLRRDGRLVGFSTLTAATAALAGQRVNVLYSGDTIVAPAAWGTTALPRAWVAGVEALRKTLPPGRCFWLLLTSGFRTYRFLPVFWREFHPRFDAPTPPATRRMLDALARDRFGAQFDPLSGIVRFRNPQRLRAGLNDIPQGRERDPHIAFFLGRNPGHVRGDELVCLTELCPENLTAAGRRMMPASAHELACHHR